MAGNAAGFTGFLPQSAVRLMFDVRLHTLLLNEPFRIAHGASTSRQVLRAHAEGAVGEAPFVPYYADDPEVSVAWLKEIEDPFAPLPKEGPRPALLALDLLQRDRQGREAGRTLRAMLAPLFSSSPKPGPIAACRSFSIPQDLDAFRAKVRETAAQFQVLKLKLGSGNTDFDEAIVAMAREAAPAAKLLADVNGGWSVDETLKMTRRLRRWAPSLIEQPVHHKDGLEPWRELRAKLPTDVPPLYADETAQTAEDVPALAELVAGVNVKLLKCGSIAGAVAMIEAARRHRLGVLLGCMIESCIGVTAAAHLAPWTDWADLDGHLYVANEDHTGVTFSPAGDIILPEAPGLGVKPLQAREQE
jgi:L-alanine-DL-glutamate epimerase-like enolase superfamily enzyme